MRKKQKRLRVVAMGFLFLAGLIGVAYGAGKLSVEPVFYDFGIIDEGVVARVSVTLTNTGDADLAITDVRTN